MIWLIPIVLVTAYTLYKAWKNFGNDEDDPRGM
jgi:hypothetical protein